eukprot:586159-Amphidinium_carterae.2
MQSLCVQDLGSHIVLVQFKADPLNGQQTIEFQRSLQTVCNSTRENARLFCWLVAALYCLDCLDVVDVPFVFLDGKF